MFTHVAASTAHPSFAVIPPLLSRTRVLVLEPLTEDEVGAVVDRALADAGRGLGAARLALAPEARAFLVAHAQGDARVALNALELAARLARTRRTRTLDLALIEEAAQQRALRYDKAGEEHYNVISAFIKSLRAGDPDAAVYWMMRMLEAGEDPLFVARRTVICAGGATTSRATAAASARSASACVPGAHAAPGPGNHRPAEPHTTGLGEKQRGCQGEGHVPSRFLRYRCHRRERPRHAGDGPSVP